MKFVEITHATGLKVCYALTSITSFWTESSNGRTYICVVEGSEASSIRVAHSYDELKKVMFFGTDLIQPDADPLLLE